MKTSSSRHTPTHESKDIEPARSISDDNPVEAPPSPQFGGRAAPERSRRIAEAAYYRAQQRGFCPGCELEDWLEAERVVDEQLHQEGGG